MLFCISRDHIDSFDVVLDSVDVEREVVCDTELTALDAAHFQDAIDQQVSSSCFVVCV